MASPVRKLLLPAVALLLALASVGSAADSREQIDSQCGEALVRLGEYSPDAAALVDRAAGVLVFPDIVKVGFGVGGQYGEGALLVGGEPVAYYATAGAAFGLQLGAKSKSEVVLFMTGEALADFRSGQGWEVGVDGSVVVMNAGVEGRLDRHAGDAAVLGFIFSNRGLMGNLTLEGSKFTRIAR